MRILKRLFSFFYTEFTGAFTLLVFAILFALIPRVYSARQNATLVSYPLDSVKLASLIDSEAERKNHYSKIYNNSKKKYKPFNKLKWANSKGYKFKSFKDLSKYTGVPIEDFKKENLAHLIYPKKYEGQIDVNEADTSQWMGLRGVGPKLAARIVKFRNSLGGFYSIDQLKTVWGLDSAIIKSQLTRLNLKANSWNRIHINSASEETLAKHPFIGKYDAKKIIKFREQHPNLDLLKLNQLKSLKKDRLERVVPYLIFD